MPNFRTPLLLCVIAASVGAHCLAAPAQTQPPAKTEAKPNAAITPADRLGESWWKERHEHILEANKKDRVDLVFVGDSITQGWERNGKDTWAARYAQHHAANLGFSGDRTQHVLWRIDHGELDGIKPGVAVVMIGTNNSNGSDNSAEEIADGIKAIVARLHAKQPQMHILLLAIFPRGEKPNPQRDKVGAVNAIIARLDDGKWVHYLDIGPRFTEPDGTISKEMMPDFLHLSAHGYEVWGSAIAPEVNELMNSPEKGAR